MTRLCLPCMGKCLHSANEWDASGSSNGKPEYWGRAPTWVAASFLLASDSCLAAMTANIKLGVIGESRETLHTYWHLRVKPVAMQIAKSEIEGQ